MYSSVYSENDTVTMELTHVALLTAASATRSTVTAGKSFSFYSVKTLVQERER